MREELFEEGFFFLQHDKDRKKKKIMGCKEMN